MCGNRHGGSNENNLILKMPEDLDKEEENYILKKKIIELALTRYMDIEEKLKKAQTKPMQYFLYSAP